MIRYLAFRLYKIRLRTGVLLSLPLALLVAWYAFSAYRTALRHQESTPDAVALDAELMQIYLHDALSRDLRRLTAPEPPHDSPLPLFELSLDRGAVDGLEAGWVPAVVKKDGELYHARLRYRGSKHFHWLGAQRSMRLRLERGELIDGMRQLSLLNDPTPFGVEEQLILELAREQGLLTPEYGAARVRLNNGDLGVYRYAADPSEGMLRRQRRMPGNIYAGDGEQPGAVWSDLATWQKLAGEDEQDLSEVARLLDMVTHGTHGAFADYAARELDLDRYATFDALDVVFGGGDHDYFGNHAFYRDPYRGKLEPVAAGFRGFEHEPALNAVDHPLLVRLKLLPGYLTRRNQRVYELLTGPASVAAVRARATAMADRLLPDLAADPFWDAYKLLPRVTRFHRFMLRPMSKSRMRLAAAAELEVFRQRSRYLLDRLERTSVQASGAPGGRIEITVDGDAGVVLREVQLDGDCRGAVRLFAQEEEVAAGAIGEPLTVSRRAQLEPGARLEARSDSAKHGPVRVVTEPRRYDFVARARCPLRSAELVLENGVTEERSRLLVRFGGGEAPSPGAAARPSASPAGGRGGLPALGDVPALAAGTASPHPWSFPEPPAPSLRRLGPGLVRFDHSQRFTDPVTIAPGTRLELGPAVTLIFESTLTAVGTAPRPIVVTRAGAAPFGGVVLQGPGTAGSRLAHLELSGGSRAGDPLIAYPGLLDVHDTRDVRLSNVLLRDATDAEDMLHAVQVDDLTLDELRVEDAPSDAVDLELTSARIFGLRVHRAGDDCLDLMGTRLLLTDSLLSGCTNNGVSAGELTEVTGRSLWVSGARVGVLAKNASRVQLSRAVIDDSQVALRTHRHDAHYSGPSHIGASELFAAGCGKAVDADHGTTIDARVRSGLPEAGTLEQLRRLVEPDRLVQDRP